MTDAHNDADRRFAHHLFSGSDDDQGLDLNEQEQSGADDGLDAQRRFAADLFAGDDEDAGILAGLTDGRTVGRTTPPRRQPTPRNEFRFS